MVDVNPTTSAEDYVGKQFVAIHPDMFRCGQPATITGVTVARGRWCFMLRYPDGETDYTPIENEDFAGKAGEGVFYRIEDH